MNKAQRLKSLKSEGFCEDILNAFFKVPRENFIPENLKSRAYEDTALPIGKGQTISQPYTIATMLSMLEAEKGQKILEVGSGCGYVLALLSEIVGNTGKVYGMERIKELAERSKENLSNYNNIKIYNKNGSLGLKEKSPFERIIISAACEEVPKTLLSQLNEDGILIAPVGLQDNCSLVKIRRQERAKTGYVIEEKVQGFVFVPFIEKRTP